MITDCLIPRNRRARPEDCPPPEPFVSAVGTRSDPRPCRGRRCRDVLARKAILRRSTVRHTIISGVTRVQGPVGGQLELGWGHRPVSPPVRGCAPYTGLSDAAGALRKACSGTSSRSPVTKRLKRLDRLRHRERRCPGCPVKDIGRRTAAERKRWILRRPGPR